MSFGIIAHWQMKWTQMEKSARGQNDRSWYTCIYKQNGNKIVESEKKGEKNNISFHCYRKKRNVKKKLSEWKWGLKMCQY